MKIVTIIENLVYKQGLVAEHGLSVYIETGHKKIIFDTGQTGLFLQNAQKLGIVIEDIDILVLSHGHYDHTGGLYSFLEKNKKAKIYLKKEIFVPKYHGHQRFIGTLRKATLQEDRIIYVNDLTEIDDQILIIPQIPIKHSIDTHFEGLYISKDHLYTSDEFNDELFLAIKQKDRIHVITACSHRGITNICGIAKELFNLPFGCILGGFHLKESTEDQLMHIVQTMNQLKPESIGVCHCTGVEKYEDMSRLCIAPVFYNYTGNILIL